jgi:hypothetical protein
MILTNYHLRVSLSTHALKLEARLKYEVANGAITK